MNDNLIPALTQVPFLAIFMWFVVWVTKNNRSERAERDDVWRKFLDDERGQRRDAMQQGLEAVRSLTQDMSRMVDRVSIVANSEQAGLKIVESMEEELQILVNQHADPESVFATSRLHRIAGHCTTLLETVGKEAQLDPRITTAIEETVGAIRKELE